MNINDYFLFKNLPTLDLHGYDPDSANFIINAFISDNYKLKNEIILIIHGIGNGTLQKVTSNCLAKNTFVLEFKRDYFNPGCTVVRLKV